MAGTPIIKPWLRQLIAALILGICVFILFQLSSLLLSKQIIEVDDFVEYWAAGRLNLTGGNPYSPEQLLPLQLYAGRTFNVPVMMWNPPYTLPLVMPFGALEYRLSRFLWFLLHIALIVGCASFIWRFYQGSPARTWIAWLVAFSFIPTLFTLKVGQISVFLLLGTVLFLKFIQRPAWWLAALSMLLMVIKPHTLYLVPLAFLFWTISRRHWALLAGSTLGILAATAIALLFNPSVLQQYVYAARHYLPYLWATPTIGGTLRHFLGPDKLWLQFAPAALGVVWFGYYWSKNRLDWQWPQQLPLLVAISVLTASYGWTFDYVVLILVILPVVVGMCQQGWNSATIVTLSLYLAIDAAVLTANLSGGIQHDFWYMWLAPALVGWYLLTVHLGMVRHQA